MRSTISNRAPCLVAKGMRSARRMWMLDRLTSSRQHGTNLPQQARAVFERIWTESHSMASSIPEHSAVAVAERANAQLRDSNQFLEPTSPKSIMASSCHQRGSATMRGMEILTRHNIFLSQTLQCAHVSNINELYNTRRERSPPLLAVITGGIGHFHKARASSGLIPLSCTPFTVSQLSTDPTRVLRPRRAHIRARFLTLLHERLRSHGR